MAQELADRCSVGVEGEIGREVVGGGCVEQDLPRLHEQHDLGRDDRLCAARDAELAVDLEIVHAVGGARRPTPGSLGRHHGGCDPPFRGHAIQSRQELRCNILCDGVIADRCKRRSWERLNRHSRCLRRRNRGWDRRR